MSWRRSAASSWTTCKVEAWARQPGHAAAAAIASAEQRLGLLLLAYGP